MGKKQEFDHGKRYSKISNALKSYFFRLIYVKEMTIKDSARICHLNYSTAKAIIRDLTQKERDYINSQILNSKMIRKQYSGQNMQRSDYRETFSNESDHQNYQFGHTVNYHGALISKPIKKINIVSTTGYDFLKADVIKIEN